MTESVWLAIKAGEERRYCSPRQWSAEFCAVLVRNGYEIVRLEFDWPDTASAVARGKVIRASMPTIPEGR